MKAKREYLKLKKRSKRLLRSKKRVYKLNKFQGYLKRFSDKYYRVRADYRYTKVRMKHHRRYVSYKKMREWYLKSNSYKFSNRKRGI